MQSRDIGSSALFWRKAPGQGAGRSQRRDSRRRSRLERPPSQAKSSWKALCTPGTGVNLWGESPLYVNPVNMLNMLIKILAEGKGGTVRDRLKEASDKAVSQRTETAYKAQSPGKSAQHDKAQDSGDRVNAVVA